MIPRLHLICDAATLARSGFDADAAALSAHRDALLLHLRARELGAHALSLFVGRLRSEHGLRVVVNDRIDVALAAEAEGVQLGQRSVDATTARALLGRHRRIGASVHSVEEATEPRVEAADFLLVGTMYETPSHPGRVPQGPGVLEALIGVDPRPRIAIGGITPERVEVLSMLGAHGIAVRSGVWDAARPRAAAEAYLDALARSGPVAATSMVPDSNAQEGLS